MSDNSEADYTIRAKQRLWVVTELYYPEETSTGYYLTQIAEGLADDFDIKVICGQPNYSARGLQAAKHEIFQNVEIFRAFGTRLNKNVIIFRLINMLTFTSAVFFQGLFKFRAGDRVLVVTTPPTLPFTVAAASLARGSGYNLLIHDNYPEIIVAAGKTGENSFLERWINFCNRWLYKHTNKIIVVGRDMKALLERKTSGLDIPIAVIQNWAELETVEPVPRSNNKLLLELNLWDKFIFLYAGNMGHPNDMETLIECADRLRDDPTIHFIFLGAGAKSYWLSKAVSDLKLKNVTLLSPRPRSEQIDFLNACDVGVVSLVSRMKGVSMPSRTYNILAAGKPILALTDEGSELALVIDEENVGWRVAPGNGQQLLSVVRQIYKDRNKMAGLAKRARLCALEKYSLKVALEKYRFELCDGNKL